MSDSEFNSKGDKEISQTSKNVTKNFSFREDSTSKSDASQVNDHKEEKHELSDEISMTDGSAKIIDNLVSDDITEIKKESALNPSVVTERTHPIITPAYTNWFDIHKIHNEIEKVSLPEYFSGLNKSKTPIIYLKYRNFMINTYRLNPEEYLTVTSCRRSLVGDVGGIMRIHKFLERWGLINYQVRPEARPKSWGTNGLPYTGDFKIHYDTPRGLFPFQTYQPQTEFPRLEDIKSLAKERIKGKHATENGTNEKKHEGSEQDLDSAHVTKKARLDNSIKPESEVSTWTPHELAKLYAAVDKFKDNWFETAQFVGTKSAEQCILRFLQLPINDSYLENYEESIGVLRLAPKAAFNKDESPVLSTVAFLAGLVDPEVAAAAAGLSLEDVKKRTGEVLRELDTATGSPKVQTADQLNNEEKKKSPSLNGDINDSKDVKDVPVGAVIEDNEDQEQNQKKDQEQEQEQVLNGKNSSPKREAPVFVKEPSSNVSESAAVGLSCLAARSAVFAAYQKQELQSLILSMVNYEVSKLYVKLEKLESIERSLEYEKKLIVAQEEEVLLDRLSLLETTTRVVQILKQATDTGDHNLAVEAKLLILENTKERMDLVEDGETPVQPVRPVSVEAPQSYKYWLL